MSSHNIFKFKMASAAVLTGALRIESGLIARLYIARFKRKVAFEHTQLSQIWINLRMRTLLSGLLISVDEFCYSGSVSGQRKSCSELCGFIG